MFYICVWMKNCRFQGDADCGIAPIRRARNVFIKSKPFKLCVGYGLYLSISWISSLT